MDGYLKINKKGIKLKLMHIFQRRVFSILLVVCIVGVTAFVTLQQTPKALASTAQLSGPVLFVHGYNPDGQQDCNSLSEFGTIRQFFNYNSNLTYQASVGYYNNDTDCDGGNLQTSEGYRCTGWYSGNNGTTNEDIRHTSCLLAWYIFDTYTSTGRAVSVVAHSMGGILIRQAMFDAGNESIFPPYLLINNVITAATPHQGLNQGSAWGAKWLGRSCTDNCTELYDMEYNNQIMSNLNSITFRNGAGRNPQGANGTSWTTMISSSDDYLDLNPNPNPEPLGYPNSGDLTILDGLMPGATHFIAYDGSDYGNFFPQYNHGGYLVDDNKNRDAWVTYSHNNGNIWTGSAEGVHSIFAMLLAVLGSSASSNGTDHTTAGNFTGSPRSSVMSFYNYANSYTGTWQIKAWMFTGNGYGVNAPTMVWDSGVDMWDWTHAKFITGDFDGDGISDVMAFYNYPNTETKAFFFKGTGNGLNAPVLVWDSGPGNWDWNLSTFVAGDFNGDGRADIMAFYNYPNMETKAWLFTSSYGDSSHTWITLNTQMVWDSGVGNWDWTHSKFVGGDFDGDGKADVMIFYNYPNTETKAWLLGYEGDMQPILAWDSGVGNFDWNLSTFVAGDFNGDGKTDIMAFYNYWNVETKAFLFTSTGIGLANSQLVWDSGYGNWDWTHSKFVTGDFNGDGISDVIVFYNYPNTETRAWFFKGNKYGLDSPYVSWDSGVGNWDWTRI